MPNAEWLQKASPAFRLMIATSWLAPDAWQKNQEDAIRNAVASGPDWAEYLWLVDRHRIPALSWAALNRVDGIELPEYARQELQRRSDVCRMDAVKHSLLLAQVLRDFNRAGIPAMPFKGQILSYELYGDVGIRHSRDLDLSVKRDDLSRAQACVENLGWRLDSAWMPSSPRQWKSFLRYEHHLDFVHAQAGFTLELHWRNQWDTPERTSACWARSIPSVWQGCSYQAMNPIDIVLYLCNHGEEHLWFRAKWLGDMARIHAAGKVDWAAALSEADRTGQKRVLLSCLYLLERVYGLPLPELQRDSRMNLPSLLIDMPLQALKGHDDPVPTGTSPTSFPSRLRINRYEKLLRPGKAWRESLAHFLYCREDFKMLPLPDQLFWAYIPLRPVLWAWRLARQFGSSPLRARVSKA